MKKLRYERNIKISFDPEEDNLASLATIIQHSIEELKSFNALMFDLVNIKKILEEQESERLCKK